MNERIKTFWELETMCDKLLTSAPAEEQQCQLAANDILDAMIAAMKVKHKDCRHELGCDLRSVQCPDGRVMVLTLRTERGLETRMMAPTPFGFLVPTGGPAKASFSRLKNMGITPLDLVSDVKRIVHCEGAVASMTQQPANA